ncbi:hypothetical protein [Massilibacteroides sp.]|uniref:hypothetical protein n=1 Tax=Massilibacteroides sp. TaxID=2034766 RepID=UPI002608F23B|nr:hypothetical protein [Massilibacteroides sp.]MDD4516820.1 hypothetical protein [Massilibacteroides sp.]
MTDFLQDKDFLIKLNKYKIKEYWVALSILDFNTEKPLARIEGKAISGNLNVTAKSPIRRTCSFQFILDADTVDITNIDNLISIKTKIKFFIGIQNPFFKNESYQKYGEKLWFNQGVFVITKASSQVSTSSATVSCEFMDKTAFLNGFCGGTLQSTVEFHEKIIIDSEGNTTTEYPIIKDIIKELVHHFGGEHYSRIIVDDVPEVGRQLVQYNGDTPIRFTETSAGTSFIISSSPQDGFPRVFYKGDNIGYLEVDLTYPGELIFQAGSYVTQVLDAIVDTLGNYEYFYDTEGFFHFQQKKNFYKTGNAPLNLNVNQDSEIWQLYLANFPDNSYINEFADSSLISSASFSPDIQNIKNDFVVWGSRKSGNNEKLVRYHLAIDSRPKPIPWTDYENGSLCFKDIYEIRDSKTNAILRYQIENSPLTGEKSSLFTPNLKTAFSHLPEEFHFNWREELYRQALMAYGSSTKATYYDEELKSEWRYLFDPLSNGSTKSFKSEWENLFTTPWYGYNPDTINAPDKIQYWLDIIDSDSMIGKYSVNQLGRRCHVVNNAKINEVFSKNPEDIVFIENNKDSNAMLEKAQYYISIGQAYSFVRPDQMKYFSYKNSFGTCFEEARELLYTKCLYNAMISVSSLPLFYLEVNLPLFINFPQGKISGTYILEQFSWNIGGTPSMNFSASEAVTVI